MAFYECGGKTQADVDDAYKNGYSRGLKDRPIEKGIVMIDGSPVTSELFLLDDIQTISVPIGQRAGSGWGNYLPVSNTVYVKNMANENIASATVSSSNYGNWVTNNANINVAALTGVARLSYSIGTTSKYCKDGEGNPRMIYAYSKFGGSPATATRI